MDRYMNVGGKLVKIGSWVMLPDGDVIWWVNQDPAIQKLQETNRQLVAENERRSAEIASLKSMSIHDRFKALIVEARRLGENLGYHDGAGWVTIKTSSSHA